MRKSHLVSIAIASCTMAGAVVFQNCSVDAFGVKASLDLPSDHPAVESVTTSQVVTKAKIGDLNYIESVFRDVFESDASSELERNLVETYINQELLSSMHLYGRSCDMNETATFNACAGLQTNANLAMDPSTSSGREAARIQLCRDLVNEPLLMARVMTKIQGHSTTPSVSSINAAVRLFYPNLDDASLANVQSKFASADVDMAKGAETTSDRWKVLVLTVCESAGWEAL